MGVFNFKDQDLDALLAKKRKGLLKQQLSLYSNNNISTSGGTQTKNTGGTSQETPRESTKISKATLPKPIRNSQKASDIENSRMTLGDGVSRLVEEVVEKSRSKTLTSDPSNVVTKIRDEFYSVISGYEPSKEVKVNQVQTNERFNNRNSLSRVNNNRFNNNNNEFNNRRYSVKRFNCGSKIGDNNNNSRYGNNNSRYNNNGGYGISNNGIRSNGSQVRVNNEIEGPTKVRVIELVNPNQTSTLTPADRSMLHIHPIWDEEDGITNMLSMIAYDSDSNMTFLANHLEEFLLEDIYKLDLTFDR
ncbi:hypothetical protein ACTA71_008130 [Dictyostelium dimigraforme]